MILTLVIVSNASTHLQNNCCCGWHISNMGNTITNRRKSRNNSTSFTPSLFGKPSLERKGNKQRYELRSKTLPARNRKGKISKTAVKNAAQTLPNHKLHYAGAAGGTPPCTEPPTPPPPNGETSRVLFLLYLIHRTWNVITDTKSKRSVKGPQRAPHLSSISPVNSSSKHLYFLFCFQQFPPCQSLGETFKSRFFLRNWK